MDNKVKLQQAIKLTEALKTKQEAFILLEKMDKIEEKIDAIKPVVLTKIEQKLQELKDEETEIILEII